MNSYENQRVFFEVISKMYVDYLRLYRFFNNGSVEGRTSFADFYWMHTYNYRSMSLTGSVTK